MPLSEQEKEELASVVTTLGAASAALQKVLGAAEPPGVTKAQIEVLQKTYAEISNYDRHYSITRSSLTVLVVGAGLVAAGDANKAVQILTSSACPTSLDGLLSAASSIIAPFALTWLLFLLAIIVSLHFQRLTYACRLLEEEIESRIAVAAGFAVAKKQTGVEGSVEGFRFRSDLAKVVGTVRPLYFDEMSQLLIIAILAFVGLLFLRAIRPCIDLSAHWGRLPAWTVVFGGYLLVLVLALAAIWGFNYCQRCRGPRKPKPRAAS